MSIIAYKDKIIAYDSYLTRSGTVTNFNFNKYIKIDSHHMFICGTSADFIPLAEAICSGEVKKDYIYNAEAILFFENALYNCAVDDKEGLWKIPIALESTYAIGHGRDFALAAMDCGCSAKEAVAITIKRDIYCGGRIRTFKL